MTGKMVDLMAIVSNFKTPGLTLESALEGLCVAVFVGLIIVKLCAPKLQLPPGPFALPIVGNWLQVGNDLNHRNLAEMAKKYGDVFNLRMGQRNVVVVSSPEVAREVLHTQGVEFGSRTRNVVFDLFTGNGQDMAFTVYGEHWRKMRRIMTVPFFTTKVVQQARTAWEEEALSAIADIQANPAAATTGTVIRTRLQLLMYNVMYRLMFDSRFESESDPLYQKLKALNNQRSERAQSFDYNYGDFIPVLRPFLRGYLKICQDVKDRRMALFKESFLDKRKELLATKPDTSKAGIDHIMDSEKKGEINNDNVLYIVENINVAAIETTLWSLEWGVAELVNNRAIQDRIRTELTDTLGKGNLITEPDTYNNKLPYLTAFVKEVMRLHMAIPLLVPHMNLTQAKLAGFDIPAESKILVNAWWIGNNPLHWEDPEKFMPERFLHGNAKEANGNYDFRFLPFGAGRRACPGNIIALPLLAIVLGRLVQTCELLPPPGVKTVDVSENGGQFSLHIATHSTVVVKPIAA